MNTLPLSLTRVVTELAGVNTLHTLVWVYLHKLGAADDTQVCLHEGRNKRSSGGINASGMNRWAGSDGRSTRGGF